jgi:hypothetical protein
VRDAEAAGIVAAGRGGMFLAAHCSRRRHCSGSRRVRRTEGGGGGVVLCPEHPPARPSTPSTPAGTVPIGARSRTDFHRSERLLHQYQVMSRQRQRVTSQIQIERYAQQQHRNTANRASD